MKYNNIYEGTFIERPNRFIAKVNMDDKIETVHVKNTGRCKELLIPNTKVYLEKSDNINRKTKYDLVCVEKVINNNILLINIDSQAPNNVTEEWLYKSNIFSNNAIIKREATYKNSRFDFNIKDGNRNVFLEVKGVTLENDGVVSFPDAPTERGIKHINELINCLDDDYEAYILFVVQMKGASYFTTSDINHIEFGEALRKARNKGVKIIAMDCIVKPNELVIDKEVPIIL